MLNFGGLKPSEGSSQCLSTGLPPLGTMFGARALHNEGHRNGRHGPTFVETKAMLLKLDPCDFEARLCPENNMRNFKKFRNNVQSYKMI